MIIVHIHGGLGNQMFQYALVRNLSAKYEVEFKLDILHSWPSTRKYDLPNLRIVNNLATVGEVRSCKEKFYFNEKQFTFDKDVLEIKNGYLMGYWQTEKYFNTPEIRKILVKEFKPKVIKKVGIYEEICESSETISLHVRRGDYLLCQDYHGICSTEYYLSAITYIKEKCHYPKLFVFSDDMEWVRDNIKVDIPMYYSEGNYSYEDIYLMSKCRHNIISNSSFGWWGAWLNNFKYKNVVTPKRWFTDTKMHEQEQDIRPSSWIQL